MLNEVVIKSREQSRFLQPFLFKPPNEFPFLLFQVHLITISNIFCAFHCWVQLVCEECEVKRDRDEGKTQHPRTGSPHNHRHAHSHAHTRTHKDTRTQEHTSTPAHKVELKEEGLERKGRKEGLGKKRKKKKKKKGYKGTNLPSFSFFLFLISLKKVPTMKVEDEDGGGKSDFGITLNGTQDSQDGLVSFFFFFFFFFFFLFLFCFLFFLFFFFFFFFLFSFFFFLFLFSFFFSFNSFFLSSFLL